MARFLSTRGEAEAKGEDERSREAGGGNVDRGGGEDEVEI